MCLTVEGDSTVQLGRGALLYIGMWPIEVLKLLCLLHLDSPLHGWSPAKGSQVSTSTLPVSQAPCSHIPHCLLDKASLNEKITPLKVFQVRIPFILNAFYIHEAHTQFFASSTCFQYMFNKWWSDFSHRSNIGIPSAWNTRQKEPDSSTDNTRNDA